MVEEDGRGMETVGGRERPGNVLNRTLMGSECSMARSGERVLKDLKGRLAVSSHGLLA